MHENQPSTAKLSPDEVAWQLSFDEGERAESLDDLRMYHVAKLALFDAVKAVMIGGRYLDQDALQEINSLTEKTARLYAYVAGAEQDLDDRAGVAARLMHGAADDLGRLTARFGAERKLEQNTIDEYIPVFTQVLLESDPDTHGQILADYFAALHASEIGMMLQSVHDSDS